MFPKLKSRSFKGLIVAFLLAITLLSMPLAAFARPVDSNSTVQANQQAANTPWAGEKAVTETTDSIMARQAVTPAMSKPQKPRLRSNRENLPQNPASPAAPPAGVSPSSPDNQGGPFTPQTLGTNFDGPTLTDAGAFPPDTMGTVGPSQFIVAINGRFRSYNKTTGAADGALNADPDVFFNSVTTPVGGGIIGNFTSDPRIRYDRVTQRWIIIIIDVPYTSTAPFTLSANRVLFAVSDAASAGVISGSTVWSFYFFKQDTVAPAGDTGNFADYPTLGVDNNALYIGANMFTPGGAFAGTSAWVVRKTSILSGGPIVATAFRNLTGTTTGPGPSTPQGVDNDNPAATEGYFIGADNATFGTLMLRRISNPGGTPTISANLSLTVPLTAYPFTVPHLGNTGGTNGNLDALDDRLYAAGIRNGTLWTAHNIGVNSTGTTAAADRNGSRWYQIGTLSTTPTLLQSGTVFDNAAANPLFYWIPTINTSGQGHTAMGFSTAGTAARPNAATVGRLSGDAAGTMQTPTNYTNTTFNYNPPSDPGGTGGRRWGDYSYTSVDPDDNMTMWTIQEYTQATNIWGTRIVKLIAPPPATPSASSVASVAASLASVNVTITGTVVSGSGFYDPGAGFTKRISASISGGVTVNSVTYNSPTSVTLNISTVGAPTGAKDVTITNPDGQTATGVGLITVTAAATPATITATAGTPQSTTVNTAFATALQATVLDSGSNPVIGVTVTFTAPSSGASGTFPGGVTTATATTNASGVATAPTFTANSVTGTYNVTANVTPPLATPATFVLTNVAGTSANGTVKLLPATVRISFAGFGGSTNPKLLAVGADPLNPPSSSAVAIQAGGVSGIPANAKGIVGTLTNVGCTGGGNLRFWTGTTVPTSANNLNVPGALPSLNLTASFNTPLDATGKVNLGFGSAAGNQCGYAVDVVGYVTDPDPTSDAVVLLPATARISFAGFGGSTNPKLLAVGADPLNPPSSSAVAIQAGGVSGIPANAKGIVGTLTNVGCTGGGNLRFWTGTTVPTSANNLNVPGALSSLNLTASFVTPLDATGKVNLGFGSAAGNQCGYAVDVVGYVVAPGASTNNVTLLPATVRIQFAGFGGSTLAKLIAVGADPTNPPSTSAAAIQAGGVSGIPSDAKGIVGTLTNVGCNGGGNLRFWTGTTVPTSANNLNVPGALPSLNLTASFNTPLDATGKVNLGFGSAAGNQCGYAVDVVGYIK